MNHPLLAAPMFGIVTSNFVRAHTVAINQSPFTGKAYRSGQQDWRWTASFKYKPMTRIEAAPLLTLIGAQDNGAGSFLAFDPDYPAPLSQYLNTGFVNGASQAGTTLATRGWAAGSLLAFADDRVFVQFASGYQMFQVLANVVSDPGGAASFILDAPLRGSPVDGAIVGMAPSSNAALRIPMRMTGYAKPTDVTGRFSITLAGEEIV